MSKSGKKPEKKATQKAESNTENNKGFSKEKDLTKAEKEEMQLAEKKQAEYKALQKEKQIKYQEDYKEVLDLLKKIMESHNVRNAINRRHYFIYQLEYLAAKSLFFSCIPPKITSDIRVPISIEELKKSVEELIIFLFGMVDLKHRMFEINLEVLNTITKDFELVINSEN
jgi:hypothetical protein